MSTYPDGYATRISIHALREEGDILSFVFATTIALISIHALREEGDLVYRS